MGAMGSQITSLTIVYSTVYSGADQRKHQNPVSLAFVWGIHRSQMASNAEISPFDDVIMLVSKMINGKLYLWYTEKISFHRINVLLFYRIVESTADACLNSVIGDQDCFNLVDLARFEYPYLCALSFEGKPPQYVYWRTYVWCAVYITSTWLDRKHQD